MNSKVDVLGEFQSREKAAFRRSVLIFAVLVTLAVAILAYTGIRVRRAVDEAERAQSLAQNARTELASVRQEYEATQRRLERSREATQNVTQGINYYHQGNYAAAVRSYNEALNLDPENAYVLNLKGYSLFKQRKLKEAIVTLETAVKMAPDYAWGYFDLARAQCAAGEVEGARRSVTKAVTLRPGLRSVMRSDGEFQRVCQSIPEVQR
jgi:tetratricopeptide (TPR) repeat protein